MKTIAVIALKGGSGKSTVATHLALAALRRGLTVAVADTDPQKSASEVLQARQGDKPIVVDAANPGKLRGLTISVDLLVVDTAAGDLIAAEEAAMLADLCVLVTRPTLIDLAALVRSVNLVHALRKPAVVVLNQAPVAREGEESALVKRAMKALAYMRLAVAPQILRARTIYQTALETGRSAEECDDRIAAGEIAGLWDFVARLAGGRELASRLAQQQEMSLLSA